MQDVFENIIEKLENLGWVFSDYYPDGTNISRVSKKSVPYDEVVAIVKNEAEKFGTDTNVGSNGWIPVEEELPETDKYILLSFSNFSIPCVGRYEENETGGAFYIGDEDGTCVSQELFVNAWQPLPDPFEE